MRRCSRCGQEKPESEFPKTRPDGRVYWYCKACHRRYARQHYERNRESYVAKADRNRKRIRRENQALIRELKASTPCMDCGHQFPFFVMDFDHRPDVEKVQNIARMVNSFASRRAVRAEIAKCDIVCANCHRIRTQQRRKAVPPL
jgi:hypothetical protein